MSDIVGLKKGLRGTKMFMRRTDELFTMLDRAKRERDFTDLPLNAFTGIDASGFYGLHDDESLFDTNSLDNKGHPIIWPFSASMLSEAHETLPEGSVQMRVAHSVEPASVRGKARIVSRYIVRDRALLLMPENDGYKYLSKVNYHALVGRRWVDCTLQQGWDGPIGGSIPLGRQWTTDKVVHDQVSILVSKAQQDFYRWFVEIGRRGGMSFKFATEPDNIASIFRLRDLPESESRRKALRNWVTAHWRSDHRNPELELYVRQHLRGAEEFDVGEYFVRVLPSDYDLQLNEKLKDERGSMGEQAVRRKFVLPEKPRIRVKAIMRQVS